MRGERTALDVTTHPDLTDIVATADDATVRRGAVPDPHPDRRIGPYRIVRLLARGGMGAVYLAQREDDFQQRVALKLIHPERANLEILRRFYAERQILAALEHPGIARIFDGGSTDDDLPFFVMEYVDGEPIDRACRTLPLRRRLELFQEVCAAVQFAHQNLVVHRDLKPSNILVTSEGTPKLLDFGIAKLSSEPDGERTQSGQGPMTLAYASPEQILGGPITTATDIYSLGVLLYNLLADRHPYPFPPDASTALLARTVCTAEPAPPSRVAPARRARRLTGDLDAIALKVLRKQSEERYATAAELAAEIQHHLDDLPVKAHRGSWLERTRKAVRRHKLAFAAIFLGLVFSSTITVLWRHAVAQQHAAEHAQVTAEQLQKRAETISAFLTELFRSADPDRTRGEDVTLLEALDHGRHQLGEELLDEPELRAELLGTLGGVYNNLGFYDQALDLKQEAVRMRRVADPRGRHALAVDLNNLGRIHFDRGDPAAAETYFRQALAMWRELGDVGFEILAMRNLAGALTHRGARQQAIELYQHILELERSGSDSDPARLASSLYGLAAHYRLMGDAQKAEPLLRQALDIYARHPDTPARRLASVRGSLGQALHAQGHAAEARPYLEQALDTRRRLFGEDDLRVASGEKNLAAVLLDLGEPAAAYGLILSALNTLRRNLPEDHWRIAEARSLEAVHLAAVGRPAEAEVLLVECLRVLRQSTGAPPLTVQVTRRHLAKLREARGNPEAGNAEEAATPPGTAISSETP